ncbi:MAG: TRAP transporter fused permease subunit [Ectothiorhodospiraceae bacterium]|nr:TRAP transporter fused permease subunit [Ectothiorhodospiraceae bacterium]
MSASEDQRSNDGRSGLDERKTIDQIEDVGRTRVLSRPWQCVVVLLTIAAIGLAVNQIFNLGFFVGRVIFDTRYLYMIIGLMLPMIFIYFPATKSSPKRRVPLYDVALALATFGLGVYFTYWAERINLHGWDYMSPEHGVWAAFAMWALLLEAGRRTGGLSVFIIALLFSLYPLFAEKMPHVISGIGMDFRSAATFHIYSAESMLGIPMQAFALLVFGFLVFGISLQVTGAGKFFINFSFALLGRFRGGPAKVAIFSSGLMGSMSGGPVTNVLTTGPLSIPAMRRIGFSREHAAGVEACASTGGVLMPPIMGATAFIMASFLGVNYSTVIIAAIIPSLLYFFGLFMQIDAYAARCNLRGLPQEDLPSLWQCLKEGWVFIFVFVLLVWMLLYLQQESVAPFYATALLLVINQFTRYRLSLGGFWKLLLGAGALLAELAGILAVVGLIVGALVSTGMAATLANDLVYIAGENVLILLIMGALTSFVLGIGMTVTAAYIFLAVVLVPALVQAGLDPLASHMFVFYWGMLSFITPPVALAAFAAASIAKGSPMGAGLQAMRLALVIYFIPFYFVFNPALLMQGPMTEVAAVLFTALIGIALVSAAMQGYLIGIGELGGGVTGWLSRTCLLVSGLLLAAPGGGMIGISHLTLLLASTVLAVVGGGIAMIRRRTAPLAAS